MKNGLHTGQHDAEGLTNRLAPKILMATDSYYGSRSCLKVLIPHSLRNNSGRLIKSFKSYVNALDRQVDVVEEFVVVLDGHARRKEHHHLLLPILLQEGEQQQQPLLRRANDVALIR